MLTERYVSAMDALEFECRQSNDSVVLAMAIRLEADCLVSNDRSFQVVEEIAVFAPGDLRL